MRPLLLIIALGVSLASATIIQAQQSGHMASHCAGTQRDPNWSKDHPHETPGEYWVQQQLKPFLPKPGAAPALRLSTMSPTALQAIAAYDGITQVCASYLAGNTPEDVADNTLAGFEQTLRDFVHDMGNNIKILAAGGQVSQMPAIRNAFQTVAAVGRQAALMGNDPTADDASKALYEGLSNFSGGFIKSCWDQKFDPEIALELERQNEIAGNGIDAQPCAKRRFTAYVQPNYVFQSCSIGGMGDWRVVWDFGFMGQPRGPLSFPLTPGSNTAEGTYSVVWERNEVAYTTSGKAKLTITGEHDDKGNLIKRDYTLSGEQSIELTKGAKRIEQLSKLMGRAPRRGKGKYDVDVEVSENPCKSLD